ncbi:succinyl-diaminopimelate desuccinylase [Labrys monachus]|uniref:Succinyl-diaminopimelate desuccinylase n=1 Tax=Labrys monachus TaxID=217067 RepID=A0ABU0FD98_9HYPH|nr:succinyl-diaminopimelate desuccinylase [Labrys monachus]MDQ0392554.1 succinyl-diaminopimelate desuccinylase [Labrys monachus]
MTELAFDPHDPVALTQALIRCPSVTPAEGGALHLLAEVLRQAGFETHLVTFSDEGTPDVANLYARIGAADRPALMFAGHTDVVPPGDEGRWSQGPFSGAIVDGELFGRGAVDMKGGVAASVAASLRHLAAHPDDPIAFLITGDEEGPAINGTVKLLDWAVAKGDRIGHCILGEPTNPAQLGDMVKIGRRGSLSGTLVVHGKQGHVAYPHLANNPVPQMVRLLAALTEGELDRGTAHFDASNLEIISIDTGNKAFNVIPAEIRATFNIRFNDLWNRASLEEHIRSRLDAAAGNLVSYSLAFERSASEAFLTEPGPFVDAIVRSIEAETGRRPALSTSGGTSDARFIKDVCPVVEFGLVGKTMHQVDERVAIIELESLARIYQRLLEQYFS